MISRNGTTSDLSLLTLESVIDVGQGINVGPGKFIKKNKHKALKKMCKVMLQKKHQTWQYQ